MIELRERYCRTVANSLSEISSWLAMDAWLGGGDAPLSGKSQDDGAVAEERYMGFRGASTVLSMAAELAQGAVALLDAGLLYAAASVVRQLLETEYLLTAFAADVVGNAV